MDSYEKKYKEALEKARQLCAYPTTKPFISDLQDLFPELKKSEGDSIRKELIGFLRNNPNGNYTCEEMAAWLEKQSEHLENYDEAEKEKADFVGDGFIECHTDFLDFKEGNTYWLEYIGDDKYNVRSDNLLGKTYHITPCQLYTVFKKMTWLEKQGNKTAWSDEDEVMLQACLDTLQAKSLMGKVDTIMTEWLKSLKNRVQPIHEYSDTERQEMFIKSQRPHFWRPSNGQMEALYEETQKSDRIRDDRIVSLYNDLKKLKGE